MRKEETRDPEDWGDPLVNPLLDEVHSVNEVAYPGSQRLQGGIGLEGRGGEGRGGEGRGGEGRGGEGRGGEERAL